MVQMEKLEASMAAEVACRYVPQVLMYSTVPGIVNNFETWIFMPLAYIMVLLQVWTLRGLHFGNSKTASIPFDPDVLRKPTRESTIPTFSSHVWFLVPRAS